jgi:hypothetical protein
MKTAIPILKWKEVQLFDLLQTPVIYFVPTIELLQFVQDFGTQNIPIYIEGTGIYDGCNRGNIDELNDRPCQGSEPSKRPMYCIYLKRSFEMFPDRDHYGRFRLPDIDSENHFFFPRVHPPPNPIETKIDSNNFDILRQEDDMLEAFDPEQPKKKRYFKEPYIYEDYTGPGLGPSAIEKKSSFVFYTTYIIIALTLVIVIILLTFFIHKKQK